jgi:polar amino acid transport system permease protein
VVTGPAGSGTAAPELSPLARERQAYRRSRARRSTLVALASTVLFAAVVLVGLTSTPGWPRVRATFLDPQIAWSSLPPVLAGCGSTCGCSSSPRSACSRSAC